ncbi:uncharacterized protein LOC123290367 [Chrysoperla carnea]|uniref:uncharacterized protein LOC123290367 n=1 Tax=Chrysoperla carnea TaxID=189513 RepID=UPI001D05CAE8|nr:uncharacterized protein LOC123290367 [Chrysoperla carnea]
MAYGDSSVERIIISAILPVIVSRAIYLVNEDDAQKWLGTMKNIPEWANAKDLFNVAWITTLAASGVAAALVFNASAGMKGETATKNPALVAYGGQLALCWTYVIVIYALKNLDLGLAVILLANAVSLLATVAMYKTSAVAALLNAPIVLWLLLLTSLVLRCRTAMAAAVVGDKMAIVE